MLIGLPLRHRRENIVQSVPEERETAKESTHVTSRERYETAKRRGALTSICKSPLFADLFFQHFVLCPQLLNELLLLAVKAPGQND
jgi:hypothetical protein